jgi:biopolymer transport protein ExbD
MAEISTRSKPGRKGFSNNRSTHRSTRIDLTPMVDLGFLLITFFVFTTSLNEAKAMDILEPLDKGEKPTKESGAMTFILSEHHKIFYYAGKFEKSKIRETNFRELRSIIFNKKKTTDPDFLMFIIKSTEQSTFGDNINLLDEISICDIKPGHYAEVNLSKEEAEFLKPGR